MAEWSVSSSSTFSPSTQTVAPSSTHKKSGVSRLNCTVASKRAEKSLIGTPFSGEVRSRTIFSVRYSLFAIGSPSNFLPAK